MDNTAYKQQPYGQPAPSYGQPAPPYGPQYPQPVNSSSNNVTVVTAGYQTPTVILPVNTDRDWTVPAIIATLFCFFPTGICAIIAAVNARSQFLAGDMEGGRTSNAWARGLTMTSIGIGTVLVIIIIALYIWVWSVVTINPYT
ncbi:protein SPEC3-like [Ostrea edulis]|uniref:protein SPEC3-like n=1 Tax=Ostrea edulis TaxID=37623 RepID=UPI0024AFCA30|nr:protein SPEC3-like [Ostrea edulis]